MWRAGAAGLLFLLLLQVQWTLALRFERPVMPFADRCNSQNNNSCWEPDLALHRDSVHLTTTFLPNSLPPGNVSQSYILTTTSLDGGASWGASLVADNATDAYYYADPVLVTDEQGMPSLTYMVSFYDQLEHFEIHYAEGTPPGTAWSKHTLVSADRFHSEYNDKQWHAVSADGAHVVVAWTSYNDSTFAVYSAFSDDAGSSFSEPRVVWEECSAFWWYADQATTLHNGTMVFAYAGEIFNQSDHAACPETGSMIRMLRSDDFGRSFTMHQVVNFTFCQECDNLQCNGTGLGTQGALNSLAVLAADARDRVYVLYTGGHDLDASCRLYFAVSADFGRTWSAPVDVSQSPVDMAAPVFHVYPLIAASADGLVHIAHADNRTGRYNLYYRQSRNRGADWTDEITVNRDLGMLYQHDNGFDFPYGDYGNMAVDHHGTVHVVWGEGQGWYELGNTFYARLKLSKSESHLRWMVAVLVCVMCVLGAAATGVYCYRRRRARSEEAPVYEQMDEEGGQ